MKTISIDLETYSGSDLSKCGVYRYTEDPTFKILLFGYSIDGGPAKTIDLTSGDRIPHEIILALKDKNIIKTAFNASFERVCLSRYLGFPTGEYLDPESWHCTMVWSATLGLPLSLEGVGVVLGLDKKKLAEGKNLIRLFCVPHNGRRITAVEKPDKWKLFCEYNTRDVDVETGIQFKLAKHPVPDGVWEEYHLDQRINDRGVMLDMGLVEKAIKMDGISRAELMLSMQSLTGIENPNSVQQMKTWLSQRGIQIESLGKKAVAELIKITPKDISYVLTLRQQLAKSSVRKYKAMKNAVCSDGRARGMFMFYGANRTGRFSGRIIQMQNLPQNHLEDLELARNTVKNSDYETVKLLYGDVPDTLSQLIRTAFIPKNDGTFIVADFSAIEARVIAWIANERWRMELFESGGDIYCQSASQMFKVPVVKHGINGHLRQKGKIAELACIAKGQMVLTNHGLIPIEKVSIDDKVWDGKSWVSHSGVIFRGEREVVEYEGLEATPDHLVWTEEESNPIPLGIAASQSLHLVRSRDELNEAQFEKDNLSGESQVTHRRVARVYDIRNAGRYHRFTVSGKLVHNCGYGGSVGALKAMGALDMGLKEEELKPLVTSWRQSNLNIVRLWWAVDKAVMNAVRNRTSTSTHGITFSYQGAMLYVTLPSGRNLAYVKPHIDKGRFDNECITYEGVSQAKRWGRVESYGPKFVENIVQAISRDILCNAMRNLEENGYRIVMHIHDECVIEGTSGQSLEEACALMAESPEWAKGLVLRADGYTTEFYRKD